MGSLEVIHQGFPRKGLYPKPQKESVLVVQMYPWVTPKLMVVTSSRKFESPSSV